MANLEYRFWQITPIVLDSIRSNLKKFRFEALASIIHSLARLNIGKPAPLPASTSAPNDELQHELRFGSHQELSADYSDLFAECMREVEKFLPDVVWKKELMKREKKIELRRSRAEKAKQMIKDAAKKAAAGEDNGSESDSTTASNGTTDSDASENIDEEFNRVSFDPEGDLYESKEHEQQLDKEAFLKEIVSSEEAHFWGQILFANILMGHWDHRLPDIMRTACSFVETREDLDNSGWLQYFLYQTLYVCDVLQPEKAVVNVKGSNGSTVGNTGSAGNNSSSSPGGAGSSSSSSSSSSDASTNDEASDSTSEISNALILSPDTLEHQIKKACPMWIQERLHETWLDGTLLKSQPQGSDNLQLDVEKALARTHTQASINTSVGRESDEQHCFFAGHLMNPGVAIEYDSCSPLGPNRPRASGMVALKQRIFSKINVKSALIHKIFWERLNDDQKDEQILRLRTALGYKHVEEHDRFGRNLTHKKYSLARPGLPNNDPNRPGAVRRPEDSLERKMEASRMRHKWRRDTKERAAGDQVVGQGKDYNFQGGRR